MKTTLAVTSKLKAAVKEAEVEGEAGNFPAYGKLFEGLEAKAVAYVRPKMAAAPLAEARRAKLGVRLDAAGGTL